MVVVVVVAVYYISVSLKLSELTPFSRVTWKVDYGLSWNFGKTFASI